VAHHVDHRSEGITEVRAPGRSQRPGAGEHWPCVVIGAGPAGLATAAHLRRRGVSPLVIEQGTVAQAWRERYDRLRLNTSRLTSRVAGKRFARGTALFPPRDDFVAYLQDLAHPVTVAEHVRVTLRPDAIVAATGYRCGLESLVGRLGVLDDRGVPVVGDGAEARAGLRFVGFVPVPGQLRRVGVEARRAAKAIARELAGRRLTA
jgi:hypothetical protein